MKKALFLLLALSACSETNNYKFYNIKYKTEMCSPIEASQLDLYRVVWVKCGSSVLNRGCYSKIVEDSVYNTIEETCCKFECAF